MDLIFVCIVAGGFVLLFLYGFVRGLVDPEFKARIEKEAAEYRREHPGRPKRNTNKGWRYYAIRNGFAPPDE